MSFGQFAEIQTLARKVDNFVLGGTNFSDSTVLHKITCPANTRWFLLGGQTYRDVSATMKVSIKDSSDQELCQLADDAAGAIEYMIPNSEPVPAAMGVGGLVRWIMDGGDYVEYAFGVAQSGAARIACVVLEIPYP